MKVLFISVLLLIPIFAQAQSWNVVSDMKSFLDETWKGVEFRNAVGYEVQGRTGYSGGGVRMTSPSATLQPFSMRGPSIKAGCTGIDIDLGAFDFLLDEKRLVAFLKATLAGAPGYAFNLAMQTFCPQCTELLNKLNSMMNMINGMQFDSCAVLEAVGGYGSAAIQDNFKQEAGSGSSNSFNNSVKGWTNSLGKFEESVNRYIDNIACKWYSGEAICPLEFLKPNSKKTMLEVMLANTIFKDEQSTAIIRALVGDIKFTEGEGDRQGVPVMFWTIYRTEEEVKEALENWVKSNKGGNGFVGVDKDFNHSVAITQSLTDRAKTHLGAMESNFYNRTTPKTETLEFLSMFSAPVYQILNSLSVEPTVLSSYIEIFTDLAASQLNYELFLGIAKNVRQQRNQIEEAYQALENPDDLPAVKLVLTAINDQLNIILRASYEMYVKDYADFKEKMKKMEDQLSMTNRLEAQAARHPIYGSYLLGKGLVVQ